MEANATHIAPLSEEDLPIGTVLSGDQFTVTGGLGAGGFGITYKAKDNTLGRRVVIKECFPEEFCYRNGLDVVARNKTYEEPMRSIVKMFMREAQSLAKLRHPNIVGVHRAFEENQTAYMALDLIDGRDLLELIETRREALTPARVRNILLQLLDAMEQVHALDLLHRDISPDNIIIEKTGTPVLIDFGAARSDSSKRTRAVTSLMMVKDGYSPQEFYVAGAMQTPSSDLYALGATFYHLISGEVPENSQARMIEVAGNKPDPCRPLVGRFPEYDHAFLQAIDIAMQVHPSERLQSAAEWRALIEVVDAIEREDPAPIAELDLELSLSQLVEETNDVVRKTRMIKVEPVEVEEPEPPKPKVPEWVEEFNKESLAPSEPVEEPTVEIVEEDLEEETAVQFEAAEIATMESAPVKVSETANARTRLQHVPEQPAFKTNGDWANRAAEKEERLRKESEKLRTAMSSQKMRKLKSARARPRTLAQANPPMREMISPFAKHFAVGILLGLLTFLVTGAFNPDVFSSY